MSTVGTRWALVALMCVAGCAADGDAATAPETTAPETTAPAATVPETTVAETTVPETTAPASTVPETTAQATTVPVSVPSEAGAAAVFEQLVRAQEAPVLDLYEQLGQGTVPDEQLDELRAALCAPDFVAPTRDRAGVNVALYIRGTAQSDPATAERWLEQGILTVYERTDQDDGTVLFNIEWSDDVLDRLVDASVGLYDAVLADPDRYCADL